MADGESREERDAPSSAGFRRFRELLMAQRFEAHDTLPVRPSRWRRSRRQRCSQTCSPLAVRRRRCCRRSSSDHTVPRATNARCKRPALRTSFARRPRSPVGAACPVGAATRLDLTLRPLASASQMRSNISGSRSPTSARRASRTSSRTRWTSSTGGGPPVLF